MDTTTTTSNPTLRSDESADDRLALLLDAELEYRPEARGGFISHLAMSLVAARRLGATADELQRWHDEQAGDGYLIARQRPVSLDDTIARIGGARTARDGIDAEVRRRLPALIVAPESQFFHAPIRLELAIDAGHPAQVANALENWEHHDTPLPNRPDGDGTASVTEMVSRVLAHGSATDTGQFDVHGVAAQDWFVAELAELRVDAGTLDELAAIAAASHTEPRHFGTLHLVTGMRSVRALAPYLDPEDRRELAVRSAHAVAAALVSFGGSLPEDEATSARRESAPADWTGIARAALDSGDPHVAKIVYASMLEEHSTGDPLYRAIAATQVGR